MGSLARWDRFGYHDKAPCAICAAVIAVEMLCAAQSLIDLL